METIKHILGFFFLILGIYCAVGLVTYILNISNENMLFLLALIIVTICLNLSKVKDAEWMSDKSNEVIIVPIFVWLISFFGLTFIMSSVSYLEYLYVKVDPVLLPLGAFFGYVCFKLGNKFHK